MGPAVNLRRSFSLDLCYPIPELKPLIGKLIKKDSFVSALEREKPVERAQSSKNISDYNQRSRSNGINSSYKILIRKKQTQIRSSGSNRVSMDGDKSDTVRA